MRFRNVVVFGDSLSDIGIKVQTALGMFAQKALGAITVSPSGRFSDCRNWTDHMYEAATGGQTLITGSRGATIAASRPHQSLTAASLVRVGAVATPSQQQFHYANYAVGGDCGGIPSNVKGKFGLGQFKDQVNKFRIDWHQMYNHEQSRNPTDPKFNTLFLVWFGANDLYTAKCSELDMIDVARKVADKRRRELVSIVGDTHAKFVFVNLAPPLASVRYQQRKQAGAISDAQILRLEKGVALYNGELKRNAQQNGDGYVDIARAVDPFVLHSVLKKLNLIDGVAQTPGTSNQHVTPAGYQMQRYGLETRQRENVKLEAQGRMPIPLPVNNRALQATATSDLAHPTDPIYGYMWEKISDVLVNKNYGFGGLPGT